MMLYTLNKISIISKGITVIKFIITVITYNSSIIRDDYTRRWEYVKRIQG